MFLVSAFLIAIGQCIILWGLYAFFLKKLVNDTLFNREINNLVSKTSSEIFRQKLLGVKEEVDMPADIFISDDTITDLCYKYNMHKCLLTTKYEDFHKYTEEHHSNLKHFQQIKHQNQQHQPSPETRRCYRDITVKFD